MPRDWVCGCTGDRGRGCAWNVNGGWGGGVPGCVRGLAGTGRGWVAGSGRGAVAGSARDTVTGGRVLHLCGHLITSRIDEKRPTYSSIVSNRWSECIGFRILFLIISDLPSVLPSHGLRRRGEPRGRPDDKLLLVRGRDRASREDRAHPAAG